MTTHFFTLLQVFDRLNATRAQNHLVRDALLNPIVKKFMDKLSHLLSMNDELSCTYVKNVVTPRRTYVST